jgi:cell division protein FtsZ
LLDNISIEGATGILINFTGGMDLKITEIEEAASLVEDAAHEDVNLIFGAVIDENMTDEIKITVIATGFEGARQVVPPPMNVRHTMPGYRISDTQSTPTIPVTTTTNMPVIETPVEAPPAAAPQSAEAMNASLTERGRRPAAPMAPPENPTSHRTLRLSTPRLRSMPPTGVRRATPSISLPPG